MQLHHVRRGDGAPLVLVHGLGSSWRSWDLVIDDLAAQREVIAVDLPGFGETPPLPGEVSIATLTDAVAGFLEEQGLGEAGLVGSSMGARMVLELARRGVGGPTVALNPGGFWTKGQLRYFKVTIGASIKLVRAIQPAVGALTANPVTRTSLLAQLSARPWKIPAGVAAQELRSLAHSPSFDAAFDALVNGPTQEGAPAGSITKPVVVVWGRQDRLLLPSQAEVAAERFPDARLTWIEKCGHFPQLDQPSETVRLILDATR